MLGIEKRTSTSVTVTTKLEVRPSKINSWWWWWWGGFLWTWSKIWRVENFRSQDQVSWPHQNFKKREVGKRTAAQFFDFSSYLENLDLFCLKSEILIWCRASKNQTSKVLVCQSWGQFSAANQWCQMNERLWQIWCFPPKYNLEKIPDSFLFIAWLATKLPHKEIVDNGNKFSPIL